MCVYSKNPTHWCFHISTIACPSIGVATRFPKFSPLQFNSNRSPCRSFDSNLIESFRVYINRRSSVVSRIQRVIWLHFFLCIRTTCVTYTDRSLVVQKGYTEVRIESNVCWSNLIRETIGLTKTSSATFRLHISQIWSLFENDSVNVPGHKLCKLSIIALFYPCFGCILSMTSDRNTAAALMRTCDVSQRCRCYMLPLVQ